MTATLDRISDGRLLINVVTGGDPAELGPWGYLPTDAAKLREELERRGLKLVASTLGCNLLDEDGVQELLSPAAGRHEPAEGARSGIRGSTSADVH